MTITRQEALDTLREVVAEYGEDYVYDRRVNTGNGPLGGESCFYVRDNKPSCLVGHVLNRRGVAINTLKEREGSGPDIFAPRFLTHEAADVLTAAQEKQDGGRTWGSALQAAVGRSSNYDDRDL